MNKLVQAWYADSPWLHILKPLSYFFRRQVEQRRAEYLNGSRPSWRAPVPVIVVGNISVGGVGKTPLVARLAQMLMEQGYHPGIVSRGYGSKAPHYPFAVNPNFSAKECGDEPLMLARRTGCPVVIDPDRVAAVKHLLAKYDCNLIISDDGLQHYALARDIEIAVVDGQRGLGNRLCLPAGPLREPPERLSEVDFIVMNGEGFIADQDSVPMKLVPSDLVNLGSREFIPVDGLVRQGPVHAVAGIGNPERFFMTLKSLGYQIRPHAFADHYPYSAKDLQFNEELPVIMTEKDAVKCAAIAKQNYWYLKVDARLPSSFDEELLEKVASLRHLEPALAY